MEPSTESPEKPIKKELKRVKHVPPSVAAMFGKGFEQLVANDLKLADQALGQLPSKTQFLNVMREGRERLGNVLERLQHATTTQLVYAKKAWGGWEFQFSSQTESARDLPSLETVGGELAIAFIQAFSHEIGIPLASIMGFSEILRERGPDDQTKGSAEQLNLASSNITEAMRQFDKADQITMQQDEGGRITLIPLRSGHPLSPPAS